MNEPHWLPMEPLTHANGFIYGAFHREHRDSWAYVDRDGLHLSRISNNDPGLVLHVLTVAKEERDVQARVLAARAALAPASTVLGEHAAGDSVFVRLVDGDSFKTRIKQVREQDADGGRLVTDHGTLRWHGASVSWRPRPFPGEAAPPTVGVRSVEVLR